MNHEYCINCGGRASFEVSKPKFCPSCGVPFNQVIKASVTAPKSRQPDEEERGLDVSTLDMDQLRASISTELNKQKTSLDDLWKNPAPREASFRTHSKDPSGTDLLHQIQTECAPSKAPVEINE